MTKYEECFQKMLEENVDAFDAFREVHNLYSLNPALQTEYNETGKPIIELIREYEDRLCKTTETGGYAAYSGNLAEKFWDEIRREFPLIDRVGVIIRDFDLKKIEPFELRKIKLV